MGIRFLNMLPLMAAWHLSLCMESVGFCPFLRSLQFHSISRFFGCDNLPDRDLSGCPVTLKREANRAWPPRDVSISCRRVFSGGTLGMHDAEALALLAFV